MFLFIPYHSCSENTTKPTLRAILKHKDHPSTLSIQSQYETKTFPLTDINAYDIKNENTQTE